MVISIVMLVYQRATINKLMGNVWGSIPKHRYWFSWWIFDRPKMNILCWLWWFSTSRSKLAYQGFLGKLENISLSWIKAMAGDDFPYENHDSRLRENRLRSCWTNDSLVGKPTSSQTAVHPCLNFLEKNHTRCLQWMSQMETRWKKAVNSL